jgi:hypothetical protein
MFPKRSLGTYCFYSVSSFLSVFFVRECSQKLLKGSLWNFPGWYSLAFVDGSNNSSRQTSRHSSLSVQGHEAAMNPRNDTSSDTLVGTSHFCTTLIVSVWFDIPCWDTKCPPRYYIIVANDEHFLAFNLPLYTIIARRWFSIAFKYDQILE